MDNENDKNILSKSTIRYINSNWKEVAEFIKRHLLNDKYKNFDDNLKYWNTQIDRAYEMGLLSPDTYENLKNSINYVRGEYNGN